MKIIGKVTGSKSYLAEISEDELANLQGFDSTYSEDWREARERLEKGEPWPVGRAWDGMRNLRHRRSALESTERDLLALAEHIRSLVDSLKSDAPWTGE